MKGKATVIILVLASVLLLAACSASQDDGPAMSEPAPMAADEAMAGGDEDAADEMAADSQSDHPADSEEMDNSLAEGSEEMAGESDADETMGTDLPAWQLISLTNARTGESFTLSDFAGKTVFVEPMATWCTNCRRQLGNVRDARSQLAAGDVVFVGLSVETNIDDATLASYADGAGFDWLFAVVTPEMLQELAAEFGQTIANPPATPHFVVRPDGSTTDLITGIEPAEQIIAQIEAARG